MGGKLNESLEDARKEVAKLVKDLEKITKKPAATFDLNNLKQANAAISTLESAIDAAVTKASELEEGFGGIAGAISAALSEMDKTSSATNRTVKAMRGISSITQDLANDQSGLVVLSEKELRSKQDKLAALTQEAKSQASIVAQKYQGLDLDKNGNKLYGAALDSRLKSQKVTKKEYSSIQSIIAANRENLKVLDEANEKLEKRVKEEQKLNQKLGIAGGLLKGISKIPIIGDVVDANSALDDMKKHLKKGGSAVGGLAKGFKNIGTQIGTGLLNPANLVLGAITMIGTAISQVDKQTGEFAKSMNLSYSEANSVRKELTEIGRLSGDSALNTKALGETLGSVNKALGTTGKLSEGDLKTFTKLREQAGMSNEEIMGMQKFSMVMGGDLKKNTVNFQAQAKALSMSKGTAVNVKSLMADMGKVSSRTKLSIEGGAEGLATAAVNAKLMGGNLDQVASIADSLLNFESSISNELEAELLLGKDINLEKARTAALNNDMATVAAEITKQAGTAAEFGAMNRIQQEGIAKAMGMSADQMGDMLFEQEALKSIGQSLNEEEQKAFDAAKAKYGVEEASRMLKSKAQGEGLEGLVNQQSAQEEFNMAIEKAKELFVTIAQEVLPAIKLAMTPILFIVQAISEGIQLFIKGLKDGNPLAVALAGIMAGMAIPLLISAVGAIMSTFAMIPLGIGIPLGLAAIAGMYSMATKAKSVKDGVINPKGGIMMSGEKGSIQLDKDDSVVAGTNLFGGKKGGSSQPTQGGSDMSAVISAINTLSSNLNSIASRPINVLIDGDKIISATTDQKPNETGGAIRKNSYQVQ